MVGMAIRAINPSSPQALASLKSTLILAPKCCTGVGWGLISIQGRDSSTIQFMQAAPVLALIKIKMPLEKFLETRIVSYK